MPSIAERLKHSWNAFMNRDPTQYVHQDIGYGSAFRPDRGRLSGGNEKSIISAIYNRIAMDVASIKIEHVKVDQNGNFTGVVDSKLNSCLTLEANLDQTSTAFLQDLTMSMFDEGGVAIDPTDTTYDPADTESYDVEKLRTGQILEWFPRHVKVRVYNEDTGRKEDLVLPKAQVGIVENPFYAVMNESNSTLQRLKRTLLHIDKLNEQISSNRLDLIIQTPYAYRSKTKQRDAMNRRKEIEAQLVGSQLGIAYLNESEHVTQLNRPVENSLWSQYTDLRTQLFEQLNMTQSVLDGTADEKTMINYFNRTVNPILDAYAKEMKRKFLSPNARTRGHDIQYFRDPFTLVPATELAEIADKLTRNEILSSNEVRAEIGYKPVDDPRANELRNKNVSQSDGRMAAPLMATDTPTET